MFGALLKSYYAEKEGIDPAKIFVVSVMPCVAKKFEAKREELGGKYPDVDAVITTRELAKMIKQSGILFSELPDEGFDNPFGEPTGAGVIFGATGGVMEAALRTVVEKLEGKALDNIDFEAVRGTDGIKEATLNVAGTDVKVAVVSGLGNARKVLEDIRAGKANYHFIEVMACPGGCINGGGQPMSCNDSNIKEKRAQGLYKDDETGELRKSHKNPDVQELYNKHLEAPNSHKAHELLHTTYTNRRKDCYISVGEE